VTVAVEGLEAFRQLSPEQQVELVCRSDPEFWAWRRRGFENAPFHREWYRLVTNGRRVCVVAPREHAKTEVFVVNQTAWRSIYTPGIWTYIFSQTKEQAQEMKDRIDVAIEEVAPHLTARMRVQTKTESQYSNGARVTVAGAGKAVRSAHPDVIIGDDVLSEDGARSRLQRERTSRWWKGTVSNMAHPGTIRSLPGGGKAFMPPTRVFLVGTPFHQQDLLMSMKENPMYLFRRYAAEFHDSERVVVDGELSWAVEVGKGQ